MAIESLRLAGIKVWMITGDKMETAINIGISCNLITSQDKAIILTAENRNGKIKLFFKNIILNKN